MYAHPRWAEGKLEERRKTDPVPAVQESCPSNLRDFAVLEDGQALLEFARNQVAKPASLNSRVASASVLSVASASEAVN